MIYLGTIYMTRVGQNNILKLYLFWSIIYQRHRMSCGLRYNILVWQNFLAAWVKTVASRHATLVLIYRVLVCANIPNHIARQVCSWRTRVIKLFNIAYILMTNTYFHIMMWNAIDRQSIQYKLAPTDALIVGLPFVSYN